MNRVTERLWIGDILDAREGDTSRFDRVVSVCQDSTEDNVGCVFEHYPLTDGQPQGFVPGDPSFGAFSDACDAVYQAVERGETVLVHCHAGRSRSACVVACVLARQEDLSFREATARVSEVQYIHPSPQVADHAREYIDTDG